MTIFSRRLAEAYTSWLYCCFPCVDDDQPHRRGLGSGRHARSLSRAEFEKEIAVLRDQPGATPPPSFDRRPAYYDDGACAAPRKSFGSSLGRRSLSVRRRFGSTRRPQISAPTDFRHVYSESFQFPPQPYAFALARQRPPSFRALELSIYVPDNVLSPILPHFDYSHPDIPQPPRALTHGSSFDSDGLTLTHERSYSSMSFHLPRRPTAGSSPSTSTGHGSPPRIPPRSRLRANTGRSVDHLVERIASAIIERDRLQAEIDSVVERQSIYISSRPSTAYGLEGEHDPAASSRLLSRRIDRPGLEPMPSIPALPAAAPSFAERLSTERPLTAASQSAEAAAAAAAASASASPFSPPPPRQMTPSPRPSHHRINGRPVDLPLAPPLPLVLRPPLRKKKSFSHVSNWLFPADDGPDAGSVTTQPRPVTGRDGFYQCVPVPTSADTLSTASSWTTDEEDRTVPTTWSPGSSPMTKLETPAPTPTAVPSDPTPAFGETGSGHRPQSVGVAF